MTSIVQDLQSLTSPTIPFSTEEDLEILRYVTQRRRTARLQGLVQVGFNWTELQASYPDLFEHFTRVQIEDRARHLFNEQDLQSLTLGRRAA
eukprot:CAMPEP_0113654368 /NCGR_PEP_ID=MMETSP0017_2-20120614/29119_1 /TAXON_ID=2856 /ORGANISM="Cylindrotheca closterium" /LENGTH=91 /DNA_ID=CAMNT_0000567511 /DNA_START=61 /DNA_END=333 /DNA_ORIENTATION=- /assembly_acc=CAM_ASM_000147